MENEFKKVMFERTDEELKTILTIERKSYKPEAIQEAERESKRRNLVIDTSTFIESKEEKTSQKKEPKLNPIRKAFNEKYSKLNENEIQQEILFTQKIALDKLEKIRANTSNLVWFLIVIPILIGILFALFSR